MGRRTRLVAPTTKPDKAPVEVVRPSVNVLVPMLRMKAWAQCGGDPTRIHVESPTSFIVWNQPRP